MDTAPYKEKLLKRERELIDETGRFTAGGREIQDAEVEDPIDRVTSSELKAAAFQEGTIRAEELKDVRAALQRVENGLYGTCLDCERPIETVRLNAVPWARYCLEDQKKHDGKNSQMAEGQTI